MGGIVVKDDKPCKDCKHSSKWAPYCPETFFVCKEPSVLVVLGGPRSCMDIVRKESGACTPAAILWRKK